MTKGVISKQINDAINKHNPEELGNDFYKFKSYSIFEFSGVCIIDGFLMYTCKQFAGCNIEAVINFPNEPDTKSDFYSRLMTFDEIINSTMQSIEIAVFHKAVPFERIVITDIN